MANFTIKNTRRLGLDRSEFDATGVQGEIIPYEVFNFTERGEVLSGSV